MQISVSEKLSSSLFFGFGVLSALSVLVAFHFEAYYLALIPVVAIVGFIAVIDFKKIYFGLLFLLPFSIEFYFSNSLATDLPVEPLMIGLMLVTILFFLLKPMTFSLEFFKHPLILLIFLHLFWIFVSALNSENFLVSIKYLLAKSWYISVFLILTSVVLKTEKDLRTFFWCIFSSLTLLILIVIFRHSLTNFTFEDVNKPVMPFFRNHVNYAAIVTLFYPFIWVAAKWYKKGSFKRWLLNFGKVLYLLAIYLSFTRACMLALLIAGGCYLIFKWKLMKPALLGSAVFIVLLVAFFIKNNTYLDYAPVFEKTVYHDRFDDHVAATITGEDASSMERFYRWIAAGFMFNEKPVFGYGPGNFYPHYKSYTVSSFETYLSENEERSTVHNYFILMLVEQGIVGFVIFLAFTICLLLMGEKIYQKSRGLPSQGFVMALLLSLVIIYVNLLFSDLLEAAKIGTLFFLNIALLVNLSLSNQKPPGICGQESEQTLIEKAKVSGK